VHVKVANLLDRSVRYLESGGGRALVLLHAFPLSADQWLPQLHRLPPGWHAVAPDFRADAPSMEAHAKDVLALMTHLDIPQAVIAGLSMGGYVALALWRLAPERVSGLVLANTRATADTADGLAARDRMVTLAESEGPTAIAREMVPKLLGASTRRDQPDLEQVVRELIEQRSTAGIVSALLAMKGRADSTALLPSIGVPTLVIAGEEDTLIGSSDIDAMRHGIPGARYVGIPGAGHLSNLEAPVAFNDALTGFLNGVPRR
jgi:3-oxoadipate enol-lactonase